MFNTIVVPLDGTSFSEAELSYALALLPEGGDCKLVLAMATDEPVPFDSIAEILNMSDDVHTHCTRYLSELINQIRKDRTWLVVKARVAQDSPEKAIAQIAEEEMADLIIMASHSPKGLSRWLLGSVTEGVLRGTKIPVLVVHPNDPSHRSPLFERTLTEAD